MAKLCRAIAVHETANCTKVIAKNNCVNIMTWDRGFREGKSFESKQASLKACEDLWIKHYKKFPNYGLAHRYTGGDNTWEWLATVKQHYNN